MSINHYSSEVPEAHRWSQRYLMDDSSSANPSSSSHPKPLIATVPRQLYASAAGPMFCPQNTAFAFDLNNDDDEDFSVEDRENNIAEIGPRQAQGIIPKEPLFEKPLTPSDVGKLNRLVIPKQHAEKCFPLNGGDSGENGLLLSFEDEVGKSWRFRYSYWNSSQSYVLTKGWSRFVKEKRLDAGDIVVFARHPSDAGRLFIGWRRRNSLGGGQDHTNLPQQAAAVASGGWNRVFYSGHLQQHQGPPSLPHQPDCLHAGSVLQSQTTSASGNSKRLRLFGVNLECRADEYEPSRPVGSPVSSQGQGHHLHTYHQQYPNHMDASFSGGDAYRQG